MAQSTFDPQRGLIGALSGENEPIPKSTNKPVNKGPIVPGLEGAAVCASVYGGGSGKCGFVKPTDLAFAELSRNPSAFDFSALGNLPCGTKIIISYKGRSIEATKMDVGAGGKGCNGHPRAIDLSPGAAAALGFPPGIDTVNWAPVGGSKAFAESPAGKAPAKEVRHCGHIQLPAGVEFDIFPVGFCEAQEAIGKVFSFITSSAGWFRIGKVVLGLVLLILAVDQLAKVSTGSNNPSVARRVIPV